MFQKIKKYAQQNIKNVTPIFLFLAKKHFFVFKNEINKQKVVKQIKGFLTTNKTSKIPLHNKPPYLSSITLGYSTLHKKK